MSGAPRLAGPEQDGLTVELVGGKALSLAALARAGLPVPPWFCVTTQAGGEVAPDLEAALLERFDRELGPDALVAVRSSAVAEDSATASFAGQLDTYLYVPRQDLVARVRSCLASARSERAVAYRRARGLPEDDVRAAVIVQKIVDSRRAGVLFTANPTNGETGEAVISAGLGLGEGVVSDQVAADQLVVERATGAVKARTIAEKAQRVVFDRAKGRGTRLEDVPAAEAAAPALSDDEVRALVALGERIEAHYGRPQDIEWAVDGDGRIHVLQARPITTLGARGRAPDGPGELGGPGEPGEPGLQVFDNANIVESFPGVTLPLTFSYARAAYRRTFRATSRLFGVPERVLGRNEAAYEDLLGLVEGRVYYSILNWYRLYLLVPGFEAFLPAWEKALGLEPRHVRRPPPAASLGERLHRRADFVRIALKAAWLYATHRVRVRRFRALFESVREGVNRLDLDRLSAHQLVDVFDDLAGRLLEPWAITIVNDFFAQQLYDGLGKLAVRYGLGDGQALRNDLLCGETGMESVEPVRSALALVERARRDERLRALLASEADDGAVLAAVRGDPALGDFRRAFEDHLDRYGDRTLMELKLETPSVSDDPRPFVRMLRNYLAGGATDVASMEARERGIREAAERRVASGLAGRPLGRRIFGRVLRRCREAVRDRENMRLARTRAYGLVKRIFRALARILEARGILADRDDIHYLTVDEVKGAVRGGGATRDLGRLVAIRREEYARFRTRRPPERIEMRGAFLASEVGSAAETAGDSSPGPGPSPSPGPIELRGLGCSPGRVTGRARVVVEPSLGLAVAKEVLVAPMTDPGWVFLMVAASAIVVEKGSLLSHTAIIGRELGIPTVVGVKGATRAIRDGDEVLVDGTAGVVRVRRGAAGAGPG